MLRDQKVVELSERKRASVTGTVAGSPFIDIAAGGPRKGIRKRFDIYPTCIPWKGEQS
jgi:hypothetical protein